MSNLITSDETSLRCSECNLPFEEINDTNEFKVCECQNDSDDPSYFAMLQKDNGSTWLRESDQIQRILTWKKLALDRANLIDEL